MTTLATRDANNRLVIPTEAAHQPSAIMTLNDVLAMAEHIAKSGLFPVKTTSEAFALLMLAQAENQHPMTAVRRYHILTFGGKSQVAMKSDVMQAEFLAAGGKIAIVERSAVRAAAMFSHPVNQPEPVLFEYTMQDAETGGDVQSNPNYRKRPKAMLWARLMTNGITTVCPGVKYGIMSEDEAEDVLMSDTPAAAIQERKQEARQAIAAAEVSVLGQVEAVDNRALHAVVKEGCKEASRMIASAWSHYAGQETDRPAAIPEIDAHRHLTNRATQLGLMTGNPPKSLKESIGALSAVYVQNRDWLRGELNGWLQTQLDEANTALEARVAAVEPDTTEGANGPGEA